MGDLVLFDVDGCLLGQRGQPRPGGRYVLEVLNHLGFECHLWSAAGAGHAVEAGRRLGVTYSRCHRKPVGVRPAVIEFALGLGDGCHPALCVDNDPRHVPITWPTLIVSSWWR